jgi:uncharacterized membrane protein YfcA
MPMVPFLQALQLEKTAMIQALGLSFTIATIALAIRLHDMSAFSVQPALTGLALPMAFAGMWVGGRVRSKLSQQIFRRVLFAVFVVLGAIGIWRGL